MGVLLTSELEGTVAVTRRVKLGSVIKSASVAAFVSTVPEKPSGTTSWGARETTMETGNEDLIIAFGAIDMPKSQGTGYRNPWAISVHCPGNWNCRSLGRDDVGQRAIPMWRSRSPVTDGGTQPSAATTAITSSCPRPRPRPRQQTRRGYWPTRRPSYPSPETRIPSSGACSQCYPFTHAVHKAAELKV